MNGGSLDTEFCPLATKSKHCDKTKAESTPEIAVKRADLDSVYCCAFLPAIFDKSRKLERVDQPELVSAQPLPIRFNPVSVSFRRPAFSRFIPYLPDRRDTFVKNCVFRI